jgi:hypothetical protein
MMKKSYIKPQLIQHGNVETLTLEAGQPNRDAKTGPNDTAFPNG